VHFIDGNNLIPFTYTVPMLFLPKVTIYINSLTSTGDSPAAAHTSSADSMENSAGISEPQVTHLEQEDL